MSVESTCSRPSVLTCSQDLKEQRDVVRSKSILLVDVVIDATRQLEGTGRTQSRFLQESGTRILNSYYAYELAELYRLTKLCSRRPAVRGHRLACTCYINGAQNGNGIGKHWDRFGMHE